MREKFKALAGQYRLAGFNIRQCADAINEHYGPGGEGEAEFSELPTAYKFKPIGRHLVDTLIRESIKESVDPMQKEELRDLEHQQYQALLAACMMPAMQGSIAHIQTAQGLLRDIAKLLGLHASDDDPSAGGAGITQIFLNGSLAKL